MDELAAWGAGWMVSVLLIFGTLRRLWGGDI
jgi:hypothetical protein